MIWKTWSGIFYVDERNSKIIAYTQSCGGTVSHALKFESFLVYQVKLTLFEILLLR